MRASLYILAAVTSLCVAACQSGPAPVPEPAAPSQSVGDAPPAPDSTELAVSSSSFEALDGVPEILVAPEGIRVDGELVVALRGGAAPGAGDAGRLIEPLQGRLALVAAEGRPPGLGGRIGVAPHRLTPFRLLTDVLYTAARAGFGPYQLVVRDEAGRRRALHVCAPAAHLPAPGLSSCWAPPFSSHLVALGPGGSSSLGLMLIVTDQGFRLAAWGEPFPDASPLSAAPTVPLRVDWQQACSQATLAEYRAAGLGPPPCTYDLEELRRLIQDIHERFPEEQGLIVSAEDGIAWEVLVRALDAVRGPPGDAWFPLVRLSAGVS